MPRDLGNSGQTSVEGGARHPLEELRAADGAVPVVANV